MAFMKRVRLDDELISQGSLRRSRGCLRTLMAGLVSSGGERLTSPGLKVIPGLPLHVKGRIPYVGRGGLKLEGALDAFGINPTGLPVWMWAALPAALPIVCSSAELRPLSRWTWVAPVRLVVAPGRSRDAA